MRTKDVLFDEEFQRSFSRHYRSKNTDDITYFKILKGRITKARYKALERFKRSNDKGIPVYSSYDCSGQLCGISTRVVYGRNKTLITVRFHYDI